MFCPKCGAKLVSGTTKCPMCGTVLRIRSKAPSNTSEPRRVSSSRSSASSKPQKNYREEPEEDYEEVFSRNASSVADKAYDDRYDDDAYNDSYSEDNYDDEYEDVDDYEPYEDDYDEDYKYSSSRRSASSSYSDDDYDDDTYDGDQRSKRESSRGGHRGVLIAAIVTAVIILAILAVLVIMLMRNNGSDTRYIPETLDSTTTSATTATTAPTTEAPTTASEEATIDEKSQTIRVDGSVYELNGDGVTLVEYNGSNSLASIPAEVGGYKVTEIGSHAFKNTPNVQYVRLSENITTLDTQSLYDLSSLKEIYIPSSVEKIKTFAFSRIETCVTSKDSFADTYIQKNYPQTEIVYGDKLSVENSSTITIQTSAAVTQTPTVPPVTNPAPAVTTIAPTETPAPTPAPSETPAPTPAPTETQAPTETAAPTETDVPTEAPETTAMPEEPSAENTTAVPVEPVTETSVETSDTLPETTAAPVEPITEAPTEPTTAEPVPTAWAAEAVNNVLSTIGTVYNGATAFQSFSGDGTPVGFNLIQAADGTISLYFSSSDTPDSPQNIWPSMQGSPSIQIISPLGYAQLMATDGSITRIYDSDGHGVNTVAELSGVLDVNSMTLNNGYSTAYLTVRDGTYAEYAAEIVSKDTVTALPGASDVFATLNGMGYNTDNANFWHRANDMIQVDNGSGQYVNLYLVGNTLTLGNTGTAEIVNGYVGANYTNFAQITPSALAAPVTTPVNVGQNEAGSFDIDGDGTADAFSWTTTQDANGYSQLDATVNGVTYTLASGASSYIVQVCDLSASTSGANVIVFGSGSANGNFVRIFGNDLSWPTLELTVGQNVMSYGTFNDLYFKDGDAVLDVNAAYEQFYLALANPIAGVSQNSYFVAVPFNIWNEQSASEYEIVDASYGTTQRDSYIFTAASQSANTGTPLAAGTSILPKSICIAEGSAWLKAETGDGQTVYLLVDPSQPGTLY